MSQLIDNPNPVPSPVGFVVKDGWNNLSLISGGCRRRFREWPRFSKQGNAEGALGRVVAQTDPPIIKKSGERWLTLEHIIHGLGEIIAVRQFGPLLARRRRAATHNVG